MQPIRLLVANGAWAFAQRLQPAVRSQPDMEVADQVDNLVDLLLAVDTTRANVVVLPLTPEGGVPGICSHLLSEYPDLVVVGVSETGNRALILRQRIAMDELSPLDETTLLDAIRQALN